MTGETRPRSLLIIGAGVKQIPAIQLAKSRGYFLIVSDMNPAAEGFRLADRQLVVSTRDAGATRDLAVSLASDIAIDGVMTMASESAITVAEVANALNIPGLLPAAARNATHKVERQECFAKHNVPSPRFARAESLEDGLHHARQLGWPVVVKPADSAGSRGVQLVHNDVHFASALDEIRGISEEPAFLLEEYLDGSEHSIEGMVIDDEIIWTGFSDRNYDKKHQYAPYFLEDGDTLPTALDASMVLRVEEAATQAVKALGINFGPVKGDILIDAEGPKILEMAARLSGDYFCDVTAPLNNGTSLLDAVMDQALGLSIDKNKLRPQFNRGVALRYVWPKPGVVRSISGIEAARALPGVHFVQFEPRWENLTVGTEIPPMRSMGERVAAVMAHAETRAEAIAIAEKAVSMICIDTE